jgi:hypothetical protein
LEEKNEAIANRYLINQVIKKSDVVNVNMGISCSWWNRIEAEAFPSVTSSPASSPPQVPTRFHAKVKLPLHLTSPTSPLLLLL